MSKAPKKKLSFEEKMAQEQPQFVGEVVGLSVDQLRGRLGDICKASSENDENQKNDEELTQAKAHAKELAQTYAEPRKELKKKIKFLVSLIREKGGA